MTIRVLVADDSATVRNALIALLAKDPRLTIVGQAADGLEAVAKARNLRPDVITMDVDMPHLDGLGATAAIMADAPARVLVVCGVSEEKQLDLSFRAMAAGALELIAKPAGGGDLRAWGEKVAQAIVLMAEVPVVRRQRPSSSPPMAPLGSASQQVDVVALVASTGGPPALAQVLGALPADLCVPILIAQHIAEGFGAGLLRWFSGVTKLRVIAASEGMSAAAGTVYLPPDGRDLEIDAAGILHVPRPTGLHCPSGNRLLHSLARSFGHRAGAVVLTGMGDDGAQGLLAMRQSGGATFVQDEATSVVFGMPQAALALGAARTELSLESVAAAILELCRRRS